MQRDTAQEPVWQLDSDQVGGESRIRFAYFTTRLKLSSPRRCYCCGCSPNAPPVNSVPSGSTTLRSIPTGVPFLLGTNVMVIWSPECNVSRVQPALFKTAGARVSIVQFTTLLESSLESRKTW